MKYSIYQRIKIASAAVLASIAALFASSNAQAGELVIDRSSANELGLSFDKILVTFDLAGFDVGEEGVVLTSVYEEENEVELQSLEGFAVRVPLDHITDGYSNIPRNIEGVEK
jgi:hypothetical protein